MPVDTNIAIVTSSEMQDILEITDPDDIENMERLINAVSAMFERYTFNRFKERVVTDEIYDAPDHELLTLRGRVSAVANVKIDDVIIQAASYKVMFERGQVYRGIGWWSEAFGGVDILLGGGGLMEGVQNIKVTATYGWATIPYDVKEAAIAMITKLFKSGQGTTEMGSGDLQSERIGDYSYSKFMSGASSGGGVPGVALFPPDIEFVLSGYKRWTV